MGVRRGQRSAYRRSANSLIHGGDRTAADRLATPFSRPKPIDTRRPRTDRALLATRVIVQLLSEDGDSRQLPNPEVMESGIKMADNLLAELGTSA